jgi:hypothetical protein
MFEGKAVAYPREALGQAPGLTHKHYTRLERLAKDKHSSIVQKPVKYGCKKFYSTGPWDSTNEKNT